MDSRELLRRYIIMAIAMSSYFLGFQHGTGKNRSGLVCFVVALIGGALWPVFVAYGIWVTHFKK